MKERVVVVCPGRGTYTSAELGSLQRLAPRFGDLFGVIDRYRAAQGLPGVIELDAAPQYTAALHAAAAHAPALIYACALADFRSLDPDRCEVVAVIGNSMGWYTALAAAGALGPDAAVHLIHTMGALTGEGDLGGQLIYPCFDEAWRRDPARDALVEDAMREINAAGDARAFDSIFLGGFRVISGDKLGIQRLMSKLPPLEGGYPMRLAQHAPFHTPLLAEASRRALQQLDPALFARPQLPLVDGEGRIWQPYSTDLEALRDYTLGRQVTEPYDFTRSLEVAIRELAPTRLVLLGPGSNLGGAIGQTLVGMRWRGIGSKAEFTARQAEDPYLVAMGRPNQRALLSR